VIWRRIETRVYYENGAIDLFRSPKNFKLIVHLKQDLAPFVSEQEKNLLQTYLKENFKFRLPTHTYIKNDFKFILIYLKFGVCGHAAEIIMSCITNAIFVNVEELKMNRVHDADG
jgi:hypothetical protein